MSEMFSDNYGDYIKYNELYAEFIELLKEAVRVLSVEPFRPDGSREDKWHGFGLFEDLYEAQVGGNLDTTETEGYIRYVTYCPSADFSLPNLAFEIDQKGNMLSIEYRPAETADSNWAYKFYPNPNGGGLTIDKWDSNKEYDATIIVFNALFELMEHKARPKNYDEQIEKHVLELDLNRGTFIDIDTLQAVIGILRQAIADTSYVSNIEAGLGYSPEEGLEDKLSDERITAFSDLLELLSQGVSEVVDTYFDTDLGCYTVHRSREIEFRVFDREYTIYIDKDEKLGNGETNGWSAYWRLVAHEQPIALTNGKDMHVSTVYSVSNSSYQSIPDVEKEVEHYMCDTNNGEWFEIKTIFQELLGDWLTAVHSGESTDEELSELREKVRNESNALAMYQKELNIKEGVFTNRDYLILYQILNKSLEH